METMKWAVNHMPKTEDANLKVMALDEIAKARAFHESFPQYSVTPLTKLTKMADYLGLGEVISSSLITPIIIVARVVPISSGSTYPRLAVKLPCGSASINNTFFPCLANPTPRFKVVVLFATPPFWFATEITFPILLSPF